VPTWDYIFDNALVASEKKVALSASRVMYDFFKVHVHNEQQNGTSALVLLDEISPLFPNSAVVNSQVHFAVWMKPPF
jgi:hypothetical protein